MRDKVWINLLSFHSNELPIKLLNLPMGTSHMRIADVKILIKLSVIIINIVNLTKSISSKAFISPSVCSWDILLSPAVCLTQTRY